MIAARCARPARDQAALRKPPELTENPAIFACRFGCCEKCAEIVCCDVRAEWPIAHTCLAGAAVPFCTTLGTKLSIDRGRIAGAKSGIERRYGVRRLAQSRANRISLRTMILSTLAMTLGACSADLSLNNLTLAPKAESTPRKPDGTAQAWAKTNFDRAITNADLVGRDGQCAGGGPELASTAPAAAGAPDQSASPVLGGISLRMTECEVVRRAGPVEKVDLAANERGERSVVLTYLRGPAPGIYRFTAGRLLSIERAPEAPPAPEKPRKPTNAKKPAGT